MPLSRRRLLAAAGAGMLGAPYVARAQIPDPDIGQMLMLGFSGASSDAEGA